MASNIEIRAETTDTLQRRDVAAALRNVTDADLSEKSPVSEQLREVAVVMHDGYLLARVGGHSGEWSQTSEEAVVNALESVEGVSGASVVDGGFDTPPAESEDDDEPADDEMDDPNDDTVPVSQIDGVGESRADQLEDAGIETAEDAIDAGVDGLTDAGFSEGVAANIVEQAEQE